MYLLVLSLGMFLVAYEILRQSNIEVEHVKVRVKNAVGRIYDKTYTPEDDPYEPLEIGEMFADWDFDGNNYYKKEENATTTKTKKTNSATQNKNLSFLQKPSINHYYENQIKQQLQQQAWQCQQKYA